MTHATDFVTTDQCNPPYADWASILQANMHVQSTRADHLGSDRFWNMRREILQVAVEYTQMLNSVADECGLPASTGPEELQLDEVTFRRPIVATGHQPVIFHPGILAKNLRLSQLVNSSDAVGLMISIDTDEGDGARLLFPIKADSGGVELGSESFGIGGALYSSQRIADATQVAAVRDRVTRSLAGLGDDVVAERVSVTMQQYERLAGQPICVANAIVRRHWESKPNCLELPLSQLVTLPSVREFIESSIHDAQSLHETYNATLAKFRVDNKIRNKANPFPNLETRPKLTDSAQSDQASTLLELPFWLIDSSQQVRAVLFVDPTDHADSTASLGATSQIVPRGMMITTVLRMIASDFFIHGTGGAKYDRCTNEFVKTRFGVDAPDYVSSTKTQYLFNAELQKVAETRAVLERLRDVSSKFQSHTESGTFTGADQNTAMSLLHRRVEAIDRLKAAKSAREPAADINKQLQAINSEIQAFVKQTIVHSATVEEPPAAELKVLETREFPYFFFANDSVQ